MTYGQAWGRCDELRGPHRCRRSARPMTAVAVVLALSALVFSVLGPSRLSRADEDASSKLPSIVYILADDLGYGELGCYGQEKIRTPSIDRLAAQGMRFTQHYAGAPVCAPSRCVLMTGRSSAHAEIRGNKPVQPEGQWPISADLVTIPEVLRERGYVSGAVGKWGLGPVGSSGDPNAQGFDLFYGYNCQRQAHSYYPTHLWLNAERHLLDNGRVPGHARLQEAPTSYAAYHGNEYAPDRMLSIARAFIRRNADRPFFLYLPFVEPHLAMQPPAEWVDRYPAEWDEEPYLGNRGYVPHPRPRAGYAAMISDLDEHVGRVLTLLDELGLADDTLVMFSSDNGPTHDVGGVDTSFFNSAGPLRGRKGSLYEGGIRVPMIARWPGVIEAGSTSDHVSAFQDVLPTLAGVAGARVPEACQGVSFLPTLRGDSAEQRLHDHLAFEFFGYGGQKSVRQGDWKGILRDIKKGTGSLELYNLADDVAETRDVAAEHPERVAAMLAIMHDDRTPESDFPLVGFDPNRSRK